MTKEMTTPENYVEPKLEDADPAILNLPVTVKPYIEIKEPEEYFTPREMYAKHLLNTTVEFSTVMISMPDKDAPREPGTLAMKTYEIDVAIHPQLGMAVCGAVYPEGRKDEALVEAIEAQAQILDEQRQVLAELIENDGRLYSQLPPIGLFITLGGCTKYDLPHDWDYDRINLAPEDDLTPLHIHIHSAMTTRLLDNNWNDRQVWPRIQAILQDQNHVSALQWLLIYDAI